MSVNLTDVQGRHLAAPTIDLGASPSNEQTPLQIGLRHKWLILGFAAIVAASVYGLLLFATPTFVATASVRVDGPQIRLLGGDANLMAAEQTSAELVRTEMGILNSPRLALAAVKDLQLATLPEFQDCPDTTFADKLTGLWLRLRGGAQPAPAECTVSPEYAARLLLMNNLSFAPDRDSFLIEISGLASTADLATRIANGYAAVYVREQQNLKNRVAEQAGDWLATDLAAMQAKMTAADAAVSAYRQSHHLFDLQGPVNDPNGGFVSTVTAQRLQQRNTEMSTVAAELADKSSTLKQVQQAVQSGRVDAVAPVLNSLVVQGLMAKHAELASTLAEMRANYGSSYPGVAAAAAAVARTQAQIQVEANKAVSSLSGEVAALTARMTMLSGQVADLEGKVANESGDDVKLQELIREAQTDRTLYETMFARLKQVDAERRLGQSNASVVVEATPPDFPNYPKKRLMVAGAFLASLGIGTGIAFAREVTSRRFRDAEQVEFETGLPVIGIFAKHGRAPQDVVISHPLSVEAESVHAVLAQIMSRPVRSDGPAGRVALVTSALPGEGKSSFCVALGRSAVRSGLSAFVLDCDLRRPAIERFVSKDRRKGNAVIESDLPLAAPAEQIAELMSRSGVDERSGLRYLSLANYVKNPHGLLAWPGLPVLIEYLRERYDLVLLDTPPVLAVADALKLGGLADKVLLMIGWIDTPRQAVAAAMRALQRANIAVTGAVMTKVDLRRYAKSSRTDGFYVHHYDGYHQPIGKTT